MSIGNFISFVEKLTDENEISVPLRRKMDILEKFREEFKDELK